MKNQLQTRSRSVWASVYTGNRSSSIKYQHFIISLCFLFLLLLLLVLLFFLILFPFASSVNSCEVSEFLLKVFLLPSKSQPILKISFGFLLKMQLLKQVNHLVSTSLALPWSWCFSLRLLVVDVSRRVGIALS